MSKPAPQDISSGPPDHDPPDATAVLDAIVAGATWAHGPLRVGEATRWLHIGRVGWVLQPWKDASNGYEVTEATFDALAEAAPHKTLGHALGQRLGLVPREVDGRRVAEIAIVGSKRSDYVPVGPIDPDLVPGDPADPNLTAA